MHSGSILNAACRSFCSFYGIATLAEIEWFDLLIASSFLFARGATASSGGANDPSYEQAERQFKRAPDEVRACAHSLSLAFLLLFLIGFVWHAVSGHVLYNEERLADGEIAVSLPDYFTSSRFWFESFQNWQSEFLAIGSMVILTIWLREVNSPESKEVQTPHWENEE